MGAGRRGLYSGTYGSIAVTIKQPSITISLPGRLISKKNLDHSNIGDFAKASGRMTSGGHGEDSFTELEKHGQKFIIEETYKNGVRRGSVLGHKRRRDREGQHMWFPREWTESTINQAGQRVVKLKKNQNVTNGIVTGTYKGVSVGVRLGRGHIKTIYPLYEQPNK